jgi:hypothetical protein
MNSVLRGDSSDRGRYVPHPDFAGTDSFTYRASDGLLLSNLATGSEDSIARGGKGRGAKSTIVFELVDINGNGHLDLVRIGQEFLVNQVGARILAACRRHR